MGRGEENSAIAPIKTRRFGVVVPVQSRVINILRTFEGTPLIEILKREVRVIAGGLVPTSRRRVLTCD